jgi:hypothetical protein
MCLKRTRKALKANSLKRCYLLPVLSSARVTAESQSQEQSSFWRLSDRLPASCGSSEAVVGFTWMVTSCIAHNSPEREELWPCYGCGESPPNSGVGDTTPSIVCSRYLEVAPWAGARLWPSSMDKSTYELTEGWVTTGQHS